MIGSGALPLYLRESPPAEPRTIVILGVPRGGTTMVAGITRICGVDLGDRLPVNLEDPELNIDALRKGGHADPVAAMREAVRRRNATKRTWGWKFPRAVSTIRELQDLLRNPHLVVVNRDLVATSGRRVRSGEDPIARLQVVMDLQRWNLELVKEWQVPTLMVSYEKAVADPRELAASIAEFAGLEAPTEEQLAEVDRFVTPGAYPETV